MDREILFRGRTKYGRWIIGDLLQDANTAQIWIHEEHGKYNYIVNPATVGQFTGLCDKNGVKIFEGDIVKTHYANAVKSDFVETVVFHNGRFCANSKISETGQWWTSLADGVPHVSFDKSVYMESCEVTGNIHDTPELAKEEEAE